MKTVYEWLYEIGKDELVRLYAKYDTVHYERIEDRELSLSEIDAFHRQRVDAFISDILSYEPREDNEMVFFAVVSYERGGPITVAELVSLKELENEHFESYSWILTDREDWLGYRVADTKLSHSNIREMLAYILHEASFYGYTKEEFEEGQEEFWQSIEEGDKEIEEGRGTTYTLKEFRAKLGLPQEERDSREEELKEAIRRAEAALYKYCFEREIAALRNTVQAQSFFEPGKVTSITDERRID